MEHICGTGFKVEWVFRLIKDLLVFLHIEGLLLDEDCAFDTEGIDEMADLLTRTD